MTQWLAARARNALRRPLRIIGVSVSVCIVALVVLVLIPRHATRAVAQLLAGTGDRPDTMVLVRHAGEARSAAAAADSALVHARTGDHGRPSPPPARPESTVAAALDTSARARAHRDSVVVEIDELDQLLTRAARSPLPASYRELGGASALTGQPRVQVLLDSLSDVARARDAFDAAGGVDPIFVALTGRVNAIGHALESIAETRRNVMRAELAPRTRVPRPIALSAAATDTVHFLATLDSARHRVSEMAVALDRARSVDAILDDRAAHARTISDASAPPVALAAAALVLGVAIGFAVTFGVELHCPRVADGAESERVTGVPTLAAIRPHGLDPLLARRAADRDLSPLINPSSDAYRRVFLNVSDPLGTNPLGFPFVAVTGDEAAIVATVATNVAVAAINNSRTALLIDADPDAGLVAGIAGVPRLPGVSDVLAGRLDWAAVTRSASAGRGRTIDVIPAGRRDPRRSSGAVAGTASPPHDSPGDEGPPAATIDPPSQSPPAPGPAGPPAATMHPGSQTPLDPGPAGPVADSSPHLSPDAPDAGSRMTIGAVTPAPAPTLVEIGRSELRAELLRLGRRYELIVIAAPAGAPRVDTKSILPISDAIVCARVAYTTLTRLAASVSVLQDSGLRVRGVVLWDADTPPNAVVSD